MKPLKGSQFFKKTTSPNSIKYDYDKRQEFLEKIKNYTGDALTQQFEFSAELTAIAVKWKMVNHLD